MDLSIFAFPSFSVCKKMKLFIMYLRQNITNGKLLSDLLFDHIQYEETTCYVKDGSIPKLSSKFERNILAKVYYKKKFGFLCPPRRGVLYVTIESLANMFKY